MEERRQMRSILMACMVMMALLATKPTAAGFISCYAGCFVLCLIQPQNKVSTCALTCLKDCIVPSSTLGSLGDKNDTHYFCKLGCASSLCTNLSSKQNPAGKEVGRCVDSCSETCNKKN